MKQEDKIQAGICTLLDLLGMAYYSIPNGTNKASFVARNLFKATGLKSGVPDLHIPEPFTVGGKTFHSLYIEVKTPKKTSKVSELQELWMLRLRKLGHWVEVVRSIEEFEKVIANCYPDKVKRMPHLQKYLKAA